MNADSDSAAKKEMLISLFPEEGFNTEYRQNLAIENAMVILQGVVFVDIFVQETAWIKLIPVNLAAFDDQLGFVETRRRDFRGSDRSETGFGDFVAVAAGLCSKELDSLAILFRKGTDGERVIFFHKFMGITAGTNNDVRERLAPHVSQPAPAYGHGVELAGGKITGG